METPAPRGQGDSRDAKSATGESMPRGNGRLVIVSGPSGVGKSTVLRELIGGKHRCPLPLAMSISATTRSPRPGEKDGVDYHFLSADEFQRRRARQDFLECQEVFGRGDWYGTPKSEVEASLARGAWLILEIDVDGAREVLRLCPSAISIFLDPGSLAELERRLRLRNTETEDSLQGRLATARRELEQIELYRHHVTNDTIDAAVSNICRILLDYASATHVV